MQCEPGRYALITNGTVDNVIVHCPDPECEDHPTPWEPPEGSTLIELTDEPVSPGDTYDGTDFIPAPIPEPVNPNQETHDALDAEGSLTSAMGRATCRNGGCTICQV